VSVVEWGVTAPVCLQYAADLPRVSGAELLTDERDSVAVLVEREQPCTMSELVVAVAPAVPDGDTEIASRTAADAQPPVHPSTLCVRATDAGLWWRGFVPVLASSRYLADAARNFQVLRGAGVPLDDAEAISELPPARREQGTAVVLGTATAENYFHWLFESVGRLGILAAAMPAFADEHAEARYLVPPLSARQLEVLAAAGVPAERVYELEDELVVFDRLIIPSRGLGRIHCYSPAAAAFLRSLAPKRGRATRRVYLSRKGVRRRRIVNEPDLVDALERRGFDTVQSERLAFDEQLELFSETSVLVSAHGAGLANQVFMPPGGTVVEIQPPSPGYTPAVLYWSLASTVGHRYAIFVARSAGTRPPPNADLDIDVDAFTALVDRALG